MYFANMPDIYYEFPQPDGTTIIKIVKDITTNVRILKEVLSNITVYDEYDIMHGETPEIIAGKLYGNSLYHWVIMLANDKFDYREDFPLDYGQLMKKVDRLYGVGNEHDIHHYENDAGFVVDQYYPSKLEVTNFEYEERINESKRRIKLISKDVLDVVVKQYSTMFV